MCEEKSFRLQIIQDILSANYSLPIRVMKRNAIDIAFEHINQNGIFCKENNINSKDTFIDFITKFVEDMPNFYEEHIDNSKISYIKQVLNAFADEEIRVISKRIFWTYASFHPKLYRKLKKENTFFALAILTALYISIQHLNKTGEKRINKNFLFDTMIFADGIVIIGPRCKEDNFKFFIQNIIDIFDLSFHSFELEMLYEVQGNITEKRIQWIKDSFKKHISKVLILKSETTLSQAEIKKLAMFIMYLAENKEKTDKYIQLNQDYYIQYSQDAYTCSKTHSEHCTETDSDIKKINQRIKRHYHFFQLEAFNSIGENLYNKFIPFGAIKGNEGVFKNAILKALRRLVYAEAVLFYNYEEYQEKFTLLESDGLTQSEHEDVNNILKRDVNNSKHNNISLTKKIVKNYYTKKEIGILNNHIEDSDMIQPFEKQGKYIKSVLSIPLIFDHKIRGVLHFFSTRENTFDEYNRNFLFQFSDFLTHLMVESIFLKRQSDIVNIMNKDDFKPVDQSSELKDISMYIADVFAADGVMIFLRTQNIQASSDTLNSIHLESHIGINYIEDEKLSINEIDSFIGRKNIDIVIVEDIESNTSKMKYRSLLEKNRVKSFMSISIKGETGSLEGTIIVMDKEYRKYNELSKRMLTILSEEIKLLNILNMHIYRKQVDREKVLHEIKQTFVALSKQIYTLENRLKSDYIKFYDSLHKMNIFRNIEDIKLSAKTSISFVNNFFRGDRQEVNSYGDVLYRDIDTINRYIKNNNNFVSLRAICLSVLKPFNLYFYEYNINILSSIEIQLPDTILQKVLINIIGNAIKYRRQGSKINIGVLYNKKYMQVYIDNIGIKISDDEKERIFEQNVRGRFVSADDENESWKPSGDENRGLGCYYVRTLAEQSHWKGAFEFEQMEKISKTYTRNRFILEFPKNIIRGIKS